MERRTLWERLRGIDPVLADALLAALMLVATLVGAFAASQPADRRDLDAIGVGLIVIAVVSLVFRRRASLAVLALVAAVSVSYAALYRSADLFLPMIVVSYTAAAYEPRGRVVRVAAPIAVVAGVAIQVLAVPTPNWLEVLIGLTFFVGIPIAVGRSTFNRRRRLRVDRERAASDAVTDERARIARELHDVVAHAMSVMVVQAGAARTVIERDPVEASRALRRIEDTGRSGLAEMRRLIGVLTADDRGGAALAPQPGLGQLDRLLETMRDAGLPVEVLTEGAPRGLPPGVDLAAYRVVQEGLTNVLKHAGRASARVTVRYDDDAIELEVADDGRGPTVERGEGTGHGVLGMRERLALYGGTLETGARPGGGFLLQARLPLDAKEPA